MGSSKIVLHVQTKILLAHQMRFEERKSLGTLHIGERVPVKHWSELRHGERMVRIEHFLAVRVESGLRRIACDGRRAVVRYEVLDLPHLVT